MKSVIAHSKTPNYNWTNCSKVFLIIYCDQNLLVSTMLRCILCIGLEVDVPGWDVTGGL